MKPMRIAPRLPVFLLALCAAAPPLPAQVVDTLTVFARSTTSVYSQPLLNNVDYDITVTGTYSLWQDSAGDSVGLVDAAYFIAIPPGEFGHGLEPLPTNTSNGFLIDGSSVISNLGSSPGVSPTHTYIIPWRGNGSPVEFFIADRPPFGVDRHSDNSGSLKVEIRRVSPNISVNLRKIDFGDVLVGASRDSSARFRNSARSALVINLSGIGGTNPGDFAILGSGSFRLFQDQDSALFIRFTPAAIGKRYATLLFSTNDPSVPQVAIDLEGNGVAPRIAVDPPAIDFGEVELGAWRDTTAEISNPGSAPLTLQQFSLTGSDPGEFSFSPPGSLTVPGGERRQVTLRFTPSRIRQKSADFEIRSNAAGSPTDIALTGTGVTTLTAGFSQNLQGKAEDIVLIPVELFENRNGSDATSFECLVRYNYRILYPYTVLNAGTMSAGFAFQSTMLRPGVIAVRAQNGPALAGTGVLFAIRFQVLFGDTSYAPLTLDSLRFNDGNPRARVRDGIFFRDSACNQWLRQVVEIGAVQLRQNVPNPFNPSTRVSYYLPMGQHVRLDVIDAFGREAALLVDGERPAGEQSEIVNLPDAPSGVYYCRLNAGGNLLIRRMILLR